MHARDYTSTFQVEKRFRRIQNIRIPEVTYREAAWGAGTFIVLLTLWLLAIAPLLTLLHVPTPMTALTAVAVLVGGSVVAGKAATSKMRYDKELIALVSSWASYQTSARRLAGWRKATTSTTRLRVHTLLGRARR